MIIVALLYRQNRLKQKSNEVITQKNDELQELLIEKEWLVKEIHHRVKNNLQVIMSLLDSQAQYINNEAALHAVHDNLRRVHAMALIHQKLYLTDNISSIDMPVYINELLLYARDSFDDGERVKIEQSVASLELDVSQAIPLGLIINECVVNAIKYAFPGGRKGIVRVELYLDENSYIELHISDNGIGLPPELDPKAHRSLGLDLMQGLTQQLNGTFHMENNNGLHIKIRFPFLTFQFAE
jgi:two-component sensor histidine kinase